MKATFPQMGEGMKIAEVEHGANIQEADTEGGPGRG
jgi:hypothetical protein